MFWKTMGKMPQTWELLLKERDRVLHWNSEVLARVQDSIINEDTFLMDYNDDKIDVKITLIRTRVEETSPILRNAVNAGIEKLIEEMTAKMRKDYKKAYIKIKKFNDKVDQLGDNARKIHAKMESLEAKCAHARAGNAKQKFQKKFGPLRLKVFDNLRKSEKMIFVDKRLKKNFTKKIYDIHHKHSSECVKQIDKLLKGFE